MAVGEGVEQGDEDVEDEDFRDREGRTKVHLVHLVHLGGQRRTEGHDGISAVLCPIRRRKVIVLVRQAAARAVLQRESPAPGRGPLGCQHLDAVAVVAQRLQQNLCLPGPTVLECAVPIAVQTL